MSKHKILTIVFISALITLSLTFFGCGTNPPASSGGGGGGTTVASNSVNINATLIDVQGGLPAGFKNAMASVWNASGVVTNATVTIGGQPLTYNAANTMYEASMAVTKGATYTLSITIPGDTNTYTASGNMFTTYPVITSPASNTVIASTATTAVNWTQGAPILAGASNGVGIMGGATLNSTLYGNASPSSGPINIPLATTYNLVPANFYGTGNGTLIVGIIQSISIPAAQGNWPSKFELYGVAGIPVTVQ